MVDRSSGTVVLFVFLLCSPASGQQLDSVTPDQGEAGATDLEITITGDAGVYFAEDSVVSFDPASEITQTGGVFVLDVNVFTTNIDIPTSTLAGAQDVTVVSQGLEYSGQDLFEVTRTQEPEIVCVDPDSAAAGSSPNLTITGINTHFGGSSQVEFSGTGIDVDSVGSRDSLTLDVNITIAADAPRTARDVTVTTGAEVARGQGMFTVESPPVTLNPSSGTQGETLVSVSLTGGPGGYDNLTRAALGEGITIDSVVNAPDGNSLELKDVVIASNAPVGPRPLILLSPNEVFPDAFLVVQGADTQLLSVTPDHGDRGHPGLAVSLVGQNTHFDADEVRVSLSDSGIRATQRNASDPEHMSIVLIIPDTATQDLHSVTVAVGESSCNNCEKVTLQNGFEVTAPGTLDSADPAFIQAGDSASVTIAATDGQFSAGQTTLVFEPPDGLEVTSLNVVDSNHLMVDFQTTTDAPGDARTVRTVTGTEVAVGNDLIDIYNPQILGLTPNNGDQGVEGMPVKVLGVDISFDASTQVTFSGTGVTVDSVSFNPAEPDQIEARVSVAADAPLGKRDVTVNAGGMEVTLQDAFTVKQWPPNGGGDDNGGCSCGLCGLDGPSVLVVLGLLGLAILGARRKILFPPPG